MNLAQTITTALGTILVNYHLAELHLVVVDC